MCCEQVVGHFERWVRMEAATVLAYLETAVSKFAWRVFFRFELGPTVFVGGHNII